MLTPAHLVVGYAVYNFSFAANSGYLMPFLAATVLLDLDHLFVLSFKKGKPIIGKGADMHTRFHELYGLIIFSLLACGLWFFNETLSKVLALSVLLHYVIDFLSGEMQPFYPYSETRIQIFFKKRPYLRVILEIVFSLIFIAILTWELSKK